MRLSYVVISYNRRETLLSTLRLLPSRTPLPREQWETLVVDNASTDGSADAVAAEFPDVRLIRNPANEGMCARNRAFAVARGDYLISIDDDSYPADARAVADGLAHLDAEPRCAAVVASVSLPDGRPEAPAFPSVLMGGATCFRKAALDEVGHFPREFFRQAEEYDLSFRLWGAGWRVDRLEHVRFRHDKVAGAGRASELVHRMDLRNNLILVERYLPAELRAAYRDDWTLRYGAIARAAGHAAAVAWALKSASWWRLRTAVTGRHTLPPLAVERIFQIDRQTSFVTGWAKERGLRRVAIADFGKNLFATYTACLRAGLEVAMVLDANPAFRDVQYRGLPIVPPSPALAGIDGVVLSNINPAQVDRRFAELSEVYRGPILRLWEPQSGTGTARAA